MRGGVALHVDARCLTEAYPAGAGLQSSLPGWRVPPTRVPKSHLCNWFHGPFGGAQRLSGAKENAGPYLVRPGRHRAKAGNAKGEPRGLLGGGPEVLPTRWDVARPESRECTLDRKTPNRAEPNVNDSREGRTAAIASRLSQLKKMPGRYLGGGPGKVSGTARAALGAQLIGSAEPGQGRLENRTVTIKSRAARANPHNLLRLLRRLAKPAAGAGAVGGARSLRRLGQQPKQY